MRWFGWFRGPAVPQTILHCIRLADMRRVHPLQITKRCSKCRKEVGIYPSGQQVLAGGNVKIICNHCDDFTAAPLAPGAELEPFQSKWRE